MEDGEIEPDETTSVNPTAPETLNLEDNSLLRGDAIGDTAYTHRWVLSCLLIIIKNLPKYVKGLDGVGDAGSTTWRETLRPSGEQDERSGNDDSTSHSDGGDEAGKSNDEAGEVVELETEVEEAACQLWDMTVERDVSLHLLQLEELDILELASQILTNSKAPRLTEVVSGIVANLCCQKECCDSLLEGRSGVMEAVFGLLLSTSDVPTLCELLRLIRLLLWHRLNRTDIQSRATCPLLLVLQAEPTMQLLTFLASNCLNENLLTVLLELLGSLLFVRLPHRSTSMADYYSSEEMIESLTGLLSRASCDRLGKENEGLVHKCILCLYSFIDTPAAKFLQQREAKSDRLQGQLLVYLEKVGNADTPEQLMGETSERLISAIGLSQLLVPYLRNANLMQVVAHMLALTYGHVLHYTASRSNSTEEDGQYMDGSPGWLSPIGTPPPTNKTSLPETMDGDLKQRGEMDDNESECLKDLEDLEGSLSDYCAELFGWWWRPDKAQNTRHIQSAILSKLDECHANEVVLVFKALQSHKPSIVSLLQEQLLDNGTHSRLVSLLAHMYQ